MAQFQGAKWPAGYTTNEEKTCDAAAVSAFVVFSGPLRAFYSP